jgi:hypothetical protein
VVAYAAIFLGFEDRVSRELVENYFAKRPAYGSTSENGRAWQEEVANGAVFL